MGVKRAGAIHRNVVDANGRASSDQYTASVVATRTNHSAAAPAAVVAIECVSCCQRSIPVNAHTLTHTRTAVDSHRPLYHYQLISGLPKENS